MMYCRSKERLRRRTRRLLAATVALAVFLACDTVHQPSNQEESLALFESALVQPNQVSFVFPGLVAPEQGQPSNAGVPFIFGGEGYPSLLDFSIKSAGRLNDILPPQVLALKQIFANEQPVFTTDYRAVWFSPENAQNLERMLVAERDGAGHVNYTFLTRTTVDEDEGWRVKIHGTFDPAGLLPNGSGTLWINLLKPGGGENGRVLILWTLQDGAREMTLYHYDFRQEGEDNSLPDASYEYVQEMDGAGSLVFGFLPIDLDRGEAGREAMEKIKISLRWDSEGAGRLEAAALEGDVASDGFLRIKVTECWDADPFFRTYVGVAGHKGQNHITLLLTEGVQADCVFGANGTILLPATIPLVDEIPVPIEALD